MYEIAINCGRCGHSNSLILGLENEAPGHSCIRCQAILLSAISIEGFIYILSNEAMPNLVKVGCTSRSVEIRVGELNSPTGVPHPFTIEAYFLSRSLVTDEASAHACLEKFRANKEFFRCPVQTTIDLIKERLGRSPRYQSPAIGRTNQVVKASRTEASDELKQKSQELFGNPNLKGGLCPCCGRPSPLPFSRVDVKCNHCGRLIPANYRTEQ